MGKIRSFKTGATRDTSEHKLEYDGFLSPIVLQRFAEYMDKHRVQSDGGLRDSDNWQKLFGTPEEHRDVCMQSLLRHTMDLWLFHRGYKGRDDIEEALCAIMFNSMAYMYSLLKDKEEQWEDVTSDFIKSNKKVVLGYTSKCDIKKLKHK